MAAKALEKKVDPQAIVPFLQRRAAGFWGKVAFMLGIGVPLSLVGPFALGTAFWLVCLFLGHWWSWWWFFWSGMAVVVPLLYRMELRGGYDMAEAVQGDSPRAAEGLWALSHVHGKVGNLCAMAAVAAAPRSTAAGFVEIFAFGPRQVVSAVRQWRAVKAMHGMNLILAAQVIAALLGTGKSMATKAVPAGEKLEALAPVLAYLVFHEWVGLSADAEKVWILTGAKETLAGVGR